MSSSGSPLQQPHDLPAEEGVLGGMLVSATAVEAVLDDTALDAADYYRGAHGVIHEAIASLHSEGTAADTLTVADRLRQLGKLEEAGGRDRLTTLASNSPVPGNAGHYAEIVREQAQLRAALAMTQRVQHAIFQREGSATEVVEQIEAEAVGLLSGAAGEQEPVPVTETVADGIERLERRMAGERVEGVGTGFGDLDKKLGGLVPGRMVVLGGRPGHGKSTLSLNIAEHVAIKEKRAVAIFSLEMSREELTDKLFSSGSGVRGDRLSEGNLSDRDMQDVLGAANHLDGAPLYIDDTSSTTLARIRSKARRLSARERERGGLAVIVVDYLQLIDPPRKTRDANRVAEVSEISRGLKILAGELGVAMVVCAQLNRAPETRTDKRPTLADLRESGAIEADANQVVFLYNEEIYEEFPDEPGVVEANVAKNRHGETGVVKLSFRGEVSRFRSLAHST